MAFSDSVYLIVVPIGVYARTAVVWPPTRNVALVMPNFDSARIGAGLNVALTARACDIVTVQTLCALKPEHSPPQPTKSASGPSTAVSVTLAFLANGAAQTVPQLRPTGDETMLPAAVPFFVSVRTKVVMAGLNVACTFCAWFMVTAHVLAVPVHAPAQPAKTKPGAGVSVSVTVAMSGKSFVQICPQLRPFCVAVLPAAVTVLVAAPVPAFATVSAHRDAATSVGLFAVLMNVGAVIAGVKLAEPIEPPDCAVQKNDVPVSVRPTPGAGRAR